MIIKILLVAGVGAIVLSMALKINYIFWSMVVITSQDETTISRLRDFSRKILNYRQAVTRLTH